MKKSLILSIVSISLLFINIGASEPVELTDLVRPSTFLVNYDKVYVLEGATIYVYSLKDFKLLKKFGKAGEGPKEFKYDANDGRPLSMSFFKGKLIVNSTNRMSYFDPEGNYITEKKVTVDRLLFPVNGKFLGIGPTMGEKNKQYIGFTIYGDNFKSADVVFLSDFEMNNPSAFVLPITSFTYNPVYKNKIYINSSSEKFRIKVFNNNGKEEYQIKKDYPGIKIPASFRSETLEFFRTHPVFKNNYEMLKKILQIREYYPPIRDLQIVDGNIYVITYKRKGDLWECIKLDLKGNEKGKTFVALNEYEYFSFYPILYSVYNGKVYSLVEDEDDEVWKIHVTDFK